MSSTPNIYKMFMHKVLVYKILMAKWNTKIWVRTAHLNFRKIGAEILAVVASLETKHPIRINVLCSVACTGANHDVNFNFL